MEGAEPVTVSAVHIVETTPPEDEDPVQWFLLTTLKLGTAKEAAEIVGFYLRRWRIEDWHRVLKSGCRIELRLPTRNSAIADTTFSRGCRPSNHSAMP